MIRQKLLTDDEIADTIDRNTPLDPDHPDAYTVAEVRDVLDRINDDIENRWYLHQDAIDLGEYEIVHEDDDVVVLADTGGHFWSEQFDAMDIGDEGGVLQSIIVSLHHAAARNVCDYSWSVYEPVAVQKTENND